MAMRLFAGLKEIRELQGVQLTFLKTLVDFDIVIEIGYAEDLGQLLTLKQLILFNFCSRSTLHRKLGKLIEDGFVVRREDADDRRSTLLLVSPPCRKLLAKYSESVSTIAASHFK